MCCCVTCCGSDSRVPPAEVVNTVSSLVASTQRSAVLHDVLEDSDIDRFRHIENLKPVFLPLLLLTTLLLFFSILLKVKQHEEFFPAFHGLATQLLQTLGKNTTSIVPIGLD